MSETPKTRVLIADDDAIQRRLARSVIERCGMAAEEAATGEQAVQAFQRRRPDAVLLDVVMPGMSGFDVCERLQALAGSAAPPVLIMTSLDDTASITRAFESGATDFITKPISWPILGHRLRYMLRSARVEHALRQKNDELRLMNEQLRDTRNQLLQSEKLASIGQLAAGVAHEINNPIGYVQSNIHSLEAYLKQLFEVLDEYRRAEPAILDAGVRAQLEAAKRSADLAYLTRDLFALMSECREGLARVTKIVQDLKNFSHGGGDDHWCWADVHEGLESTINIVNNEIKYVAELVRDYGALPRIECLPSELNQVFMNLLVNAAQALVRPGTIRVATGAGSAAEVWVEIADTGEGIAPEHMNRIFDPFFTTKPVGKGTGLGLALSYSIVQKHHGRIDVRSEVGRGTTFRIILPVKQPNGAAPACSAP